MSTVPTSSALRQADLSPLARPITLGVIVGNRVSSRTTSQRRAVKPFCRLWRRQASRQSFPTSAAPTTARSSR